MRAYVGIDAGGTKTHVLAVNGKLEPLAEFTTQGADISSKSSGEIEEILRSIRHSLANEYGVDEPDGVALGMPGFGEAESWTQGIIHACRRSFEGVPYEIFNDVRLSLEGALDGQPGVLVLSGTGSMVWAKSETGAERRVGGWGTLFGDEGSSYAIGIDALRAVSRDLDGRGPSTALRQLVLHRLGQSDLWALYEYIGQREESERATIASFAREVSLAADRGDSVAIEIFKRNARELAEQVTAAFRHLDLSSHTGISYAGGTFNSSHMHGSISQALVSKGFCSPFPPRHSAAYGGVLLAASIGLT